MVSAIRVVTEARPTMDAIWAALAAIPDPEIR
jgi:metal-sulfur cluster biosynthetic enzyme